MKAFHFLLVLSVLMSISLVIIPGCKYNITTPLWDRPYKTPLTPSITSVDPASEAKPGVNVITIHGHNFIVTASDTLTPDTTIVYFNAFQANVVSIDSTTIIVRRPNLSGDSITIKVSSHNAIVEPSVGPYKVDPVSETYGGFLQQSVAFGALALDAGDNLYVLETVSRTIDEATSATDNVPVGTLPSGSQSPTGAFVGTDGNLYVVEGARFIDKVDLSTKTITQKWVTLPSGKVVKYGDCGPGGYLFVGGNNTDLCIVSLNLSGTLTASQIKIGGGYASEQILAVKIFDGYVYVASRANSAAPATIWKNQIIADSTVGARTPVLDMSVTPFASDLITGMAFSSSGTMLLSTASTDAILIYDPMTGKVDNFYEGIVPPYCDGMAWSKTSNYLYLISGYTVSGAVVQAWTVYRLDMGATGGSNF